MIIVIPPADLSCNPMALERHDPEVVAQLIQASAPELFMLLLGQTATQTLEQWVKLPQNRFSHRYVRVAESGGQVVGIATLIPAAELHDETDYRSVLKGWAQLRWKLAHRLIVNRVVEHRYPVDSVYIGNLAVAPAYQGQGIGTQLLLYCITEARSLNAHQVFISVDINNPRAKKLYESLGFQVVTSKTLSLLGTTVGSHVLTHSLQDD